MTVDPIRELRGTRVLVIHPVDPEIEELVRHLKRIGCQTRIAWPVPTALPTDVDVVFFSICPSGPGGVPAAIVDAGPPLIAIIDFENPTVLKSLLDSGAHSVIAKPIRPSGILSSLVMARALHGYQGRLQSKVAKLEETLKSRRDIERATRILMEVKGSSEDTAYQLIRQQATSQRLPMGVVARSIITAHRVFEPRAEDLLPRSEQAVRDAGRTVLRLPVRRSS